MEKHIYFFAIFSGVTIGGPIVYVLIKDWIFRYNAKKYDRYK